MPMPMPGQQQPQPQLSVGGGDPAAAANQYLDQIPGTVTKRLDPFAQQGKRADTDLWKRFSDMLNNPNALYDKFSSGYKPSESYQFKNKELSQNLENAAASGGIAGTPFHQEEQGKLTQGLLSSDMNDYISKIMGIFGQGIEGEQGFSNRGYDANKTITDYLANVLGQKGNLAYHSAEQQNKSDDDFWNNMFKAGGTILGGALGGPFGAAAGSQLGGGGKY